MAELWVVTASNRHPSYRLEHPELHGVFLQRSDAIEHLAAKLTESIGEDRDEYQSWLSMHSPYRPPIDLPHWREMFTKEKEKKLAEELDWVRSDPSRNKIVWEKFTYRLCPTPSFVPL